MEKYGFVYLWFDRKHQRFYIGSHWGTETDGYICSSKWMRDAYRYRSDDFRRKILTTNIGNRKLTLIEEHRWLSMIKKSELGSKYYNLQNHEFGHWSVLPQNLMTVGEKISASPLRNQRISDSHKGKRHTEQTKAKLRAINLGKKLSEKTKQKISENHNRIYDDAWKEKVSIHLKNKSETTCQKISQNNKARIQKNGIGNFTMLGKNHSAEAKQKMSESQKEYFKTHKHPNKGKPMSEEQKIKISNTLKLKNINRMKE